MDRTTLNSTSQKHVNHATEVLSRIRGAAVNNEITTCWGHTVNIFIHLAHCGRYDVVLFFV